MSTGKIMVFKRKFWETRNITKFEVSESLSINFFLLDNQLQKKLRPKETITMQKTK